MQNSVLSLRLSWFPSIYVMKHRPWSFLSMITEEVGGVSQEVYSALHSSCVHLSRLLQREAFRNWNNCGKPLPYPHAEQVQSSDLEGAWTFTGNRLHVSCSSCADTLNQNEMLTTVVSVPLCWGH